MNVNLIIITHLSIGQALLDAAVITLGKLPLPVNLIAVDYEAEPQIISAKLQQFIDTIPSNQGILILTDLFGSTPCNIAYHLQNYHNIRLISGLNLSMLIRTLNYAHLNLNELAHKAFSGGKDGVIYYDGHERVA